MHHIEVTAPVLYSVVRQKQEIGIVGITRPFSLPVYDAAEAPVAVELTQGQGRFRFYWVAGSLWHRVGSLDTRKARTLAQLEQFSSRDPAVWRAALKADPYGLVNHPLRTTYDFIGRVHIPIEVNDETDHPTFKRGEDSVLAGAAHHCIIDGDLCVRSLGPQLALTGWQSGDPHLNYRHPDEYVHHLAHRAAAFHYSETILAREITAKAFDQRLPIGPRGVDVFAPLPELTPRVSNLSVEAAAWLAIWNVGSRMLLPSRRPMVSIIAGLRAALETRWPAQSLRFAVSGGNSIWPHAGWQSFPDPDDLLPLLREFVEEGSHGGEWWSPLIAAPIRSAIGQAEALQTILAHHEFKGIGALP